MRLEKPHHLAAAKLPSDNNPILGIDTVNLEDVLGEPPQMIGSKCRDGSIRVVSTRSSDVGLTFRKRLQ